MNINYTQIVLDGKTDLDKCLQPQTEYPNLTFSEELKERCRRHMKTYNLTEMWYLGFRFTG